MSELPPKSPKPVEMPSEPAKPSKPTPEAPKAPELQKPPKSGDQSPRSLDEKTEEWAPSDYSDGRKRWDWESRYPKSARTGIRWETAYLILVTIGYLGAAVWTVWRCNGVLAIDDVPKEKADAIRLINLGFVGAWVGGAIGGCCFGLKWMYHSVAKGLWHEDRRLWRILTPHLSGIVSLFMVFLVASGLLQLFDQGFIKRPIAVMAFGFLIGLFSDKALAKLAEVADTIFGGQKKSK